MRPLCRGKRGAESIPAGFERADWHIIAGFRGKKLYSHGHEMAFNRLGKVD
jgi:hypothetical protein